jgi:GNAT superfamily N-acetyltransferase
MGAAQSLDVSVPGGAAVGMAGVSLLGVVPTHRRRGLGRAVMRTLHQQARERGEPLAGLGLRGRDLSPLRLRGGHPHGRGAPEQPHRLASAARRRRRAAAGPGRRRHRRGPGAGPRRVAAWRGCRGAATVGEAAAPPPVRRSACLV